MIRSGLELLQFTPRRGEQLDALLLRFETLLQRADQHANLQISWSFTAWILLSVLRLPTKRWMDILEKLGHAFPQDEISYRHMEQLLLRENVLDSTLRELSHVRGFGGSSHYTDPQQRYWVEEDDTATEWFSAAETEGIYAQTDVEAWVDEQHSDSDSTSSSQWQNENLLDPYDETKLASEFQKGLQDPSYAAS
eukprot:1464403-Amphidinium_carterae.1